MPPEPAIAEVGVRGGKVKGCSVAERTPLDVRSDRVSAHGQLGSDIFGGGVPSVVEQKPRADRQEGNDRRENQHAAGDHDKRFQIQSLASACLGGWGRAAASRGDLWRISTGDPSNRIRQEG
jgi:hypothetical protein